MKRGRKPKQEQFINALEEVFNDVEESTVEEPTIKVIDKEVLLRDYIFKVAYGRLPNDNEETYWKNGIIPSDMFDANCTIDNVGVKNKFLS